MSGYLIIHKWRPATSFNNKVIYHDSFSNNQDPYIWSDPFIYSFCKSYWLSTKTGPVNKGDFFFFLTANRVVNGLAPSNNTPIYCDLVFQVNDYKHWPNNIAVPLQSNFTNSSLATWNSQEWQRAVGDHFQWPYYKQHSWKNKKLITYISDQTNSFQPQVNRNPSISKGLVNLLNITPFLSSAGIPYITLNQPLHITNTTANNLFSYIQNNCNEFHKSHYLSSLRAATSNFWMSSTNNNNRPRNTIII